MNPNKLTRKENFPIFLIIFTVLICECLPSWITVLNSINALHYSINDRYYKLNVVSQVIIK